jgi:hypothetical protein
MPEKLRQYDISPQIPLTIGLVSEIDTPWWQLCVPGTCAAVFPHRLFAVFNSSMRVFHMQVAFSVAM